MDTTDRAVFPPDQPLRWSWPPDDRQPVDLSSDALAPYAQAGDSEILAARLTDSTAEHGTRRRSPPIAYLVTFGADAVAERYSYRLARALDLPQQHVFWSVFPGTSRVMAAIRYEASAYFPHRITPEDGTVSYQGQVLPIVNAWDYVRHDVLHHVCGSPDGNNGMVRTEALCGIDAAACVCRAVDAAAVHGVRDFYRERHPARDPVARSMLARLVETAELPVLVEQEIAAAPYPPALLRPFAEWGTHLRANLAAACEVMGMAR